MHSPAVWAVFGDKAGNYSAPISHAIILDRTAPQAALASTLGELVPFGRLRSAGQ